MQVISPRTTWFSMRDFQKLFHTRLGVALCKHPPPLPQSTANDCLACSMPVPVQYKWAGLQIAISPPPQETTPHSRATMRQSILLRRFLLFIRQS